MKSKIYALMALFCTVVVIGSCSMLNDEKKESNSYVQAVSFKYDEGGEYGMVNLNGEVIFEPRFKNDLTEASCDRFFAQDDDGQWELYTLEANPKRVNDEKYCDVGVFVDGLCPVTQKDSWPKYIDTEGTVVFEAKECNGKNIITAGIFHDGMARFQTEDNLSGYINETGEVVIAPQYYFVNYFYEGKAIVYKPLKSGKDYGTRGWAVIDKNGQELFSSKISRMRPRLDGFENDLTVVSLKDGKKYQLINSKGEQVRVLDNVESTMGMWGGLISYEDEDYYDGIMDTEGKVLINPEYKHIEWHGGPMVAYDNDSEYYILGKKGEVLKTVEAKKIWVPSEKYIGYKDRLLCYPDSAKGYFMDSQGNRLDSSIEFNSVGGETMTAAATDYNLAELFAKKLMVTEDGMLGVKINTAPRDIEEDNIFLSEGEKDYEEHVITYKGKYLGNNFDIIFRHTGENSWDENSRIEKIFAILDIPHHHVPKLKEAATKEVEKVAKFFKDTQFVGYQGKVYKVEGKDMYYFISDVIDEDAQNSFFIYYGK